MKREALAAFLLASAASSVSVALPYLLLGMKGLLVRGSTLPAQAVVVDLGTLSTAFMIARTLASWYSYKIPPRISLSLLSLSFLGMFFAPDYKSLVILRTLQGLGAGFLWPHVEASVATSGKGAKGMTLLNISSNLGFSLGNLIGGFAIGTLSYSTIRNPFLLSFLFSIAVFPLLPQRVRGSGSRVPSKAMKFIYFSAFLNGLSLGMRVPVLPTYILQYVTGSPKEYSLAMTVPGLAVLVFSYFIAQKADKVGAGGKLTMSALLKALQAIFVALIGFVTNYFLLILLLVMVRLTAVSSTSISKAAQGEIGGNAKHFGTRQTLFGLGNAVGPLLGSALYRTFEGIGIGGGWTFVVTAIISLVSSASLWMSKKSL